MMCGTVSTELTPIPIVIPIPIPMATVLTYGAFPLPDFDTDSYEMNKGSTGSDSDGDSLWSVTMKTT